MHTSRRNYLILSPVLADTYVKHHICDDIFCGTLTGRLPQRQVEYRREEHIFSRFNLVRFMDGLLFQNILVRSCMCRRVLWIPALFGEKRALWDERIGLFLYEWEALLISCGDAI
jgi:hypothetical protein